VTRKLCTLFFVLFVAFSGVRGEVIVQSGADAVMSSALGSSKGQVEDILNSAFAGIDFGENDKDDFKVTSEQEKLLRERFSRAAKKFMDSDWVDYGTIDFLNSKVVVTIAVTENIADFPMTTWGAYGGFIVGVHPRALAEFSPGRLEEAFFHELYHQYTYIVADVWEGRRVKFLGNGDLAKIRGQRKSKVEIFKFRQGAERRIQAKRERYLESIKDELTPAERSKFLGKDKKVE
jgi:hypothetical protein